MSSNASEYNILIGYALKPNQQAVQQARAQVDQILRVFQDLDRQKVGGGMLPDQRSLAQFGQDLRRQIQGAFQADIRSSPMFGQFSSEIQKGLLAAARPVAGSSLLPAANRSLQAQLDRGDFQDRAKMKLGSEGGFASLDALNRADANSAAKVEAARVALANALKRNADAAVRELTQGRAAFDKEMNAKGRLVTIANARAASEQRAQRAQEVADGRATLAIRGRAAAEGRAAAAALGRALRDETQRQAGVAADAEAGAFRSSYVAPNVSTPLGKAQAGVNNAERALEVASRGLADLRANAARTGPGLIAAERRVENASNALATARERVAVQEARTGASAGLQSQFMTGFRGASERPYAEQIGQAFKFSVFYGTAYKLLFGITQTFQQTLQEGIEFQQAVSDLKLATGRVDENINALAEQLGSRAADYGFAPSVGILAGARSIGLYGATDMQGGSRAEQDRIADMSAKVVSRLSFTSGMQPADLQTNLAAIVTAYGGGPESQFRIEDLDAYMSKFFGTAPGSGIQAVSESGTVARAAGFGQEEGFAIASLLQARTGQTPAAVAGYMAQIFSRGGEGSLADVSKKYGIDPQLELSEQIKQLAEVYKTAGSNERTELSAAFGRGKVQNAAIALLQNYDTVLEASAKARTDATGSGRDAADLKLANLGGQIQVTIGVLREFANELGQTGVLAVLGGAVVVLREFVEAATGLLKLWNSLDAPMKAAIAGLIALSIASRSTAVQQAVGIVPMLGGARGLGVIGRNGPVALGAQGAAGAVARNAAGAAMAALVNPAFLAVAGLLAIGALKNSVDDFDSAMRSSTEALNTGALGPDATPDDLRARAAYLQDTAVDVKDGSTGILNRITSALDPTGSKIEDGKTEVARLNAEADRLNAIAERIEASASVNRDTSTRSLIDDFSTDGIAASFQSITDAGGTAKQRLDALTDSLLGTSGAAERAAAEFDSQAFSEDNSANLYEGLTNSFSLGKSTPGGLDIANALMGGGLDRDYKNVAPELIKSAIDPEEIKSRLAKATAGLKSLDEIDSVMAEEIAKTVVGDDINTQLRAEGLSEAEITKAREQMVAFVAEYLLNESNALKAIISENKSLTGDELLAISNALVADTQAVVDALPERDFKGRNNALKSSIGTLRAAIRMTPSGASPQDQANLNSLERALAVAQFNQFENARIVAQQQANGRAEVARIGRRFLNKEIRAAIRGGNQDLLAQIIGQAGAGAIAIAKQVINEAIAAARAAQAISRQIAAVRRVMVGAEEYLRGGLSTGSSGMNQKDPRDKYAGLLDVTNTSPTAGTWEGNVYASGSDVPGFEAPAAAAEEAAAEKETALERAAAAAAARATRSESAIDAARAEMMGARAAMAKAKKGTVEYYNALSSFYAARNSLTDAILAYKQNQYLLGIDITDPLAQAEVALRVARDKLRSDRGKGKDVLAQDRVDVRQAQADLEAQKFQQRLDAVSVAEDLGRISHSAYINYLENERNRLNKIKDRSYQQQQQLNQIDQLLQDAAAEMQGQWNFGDIKLPTPYQVRRVVEERSKSIQGLIDPGQSTENNGPRRESAREGDTIIYIDGADVGMVKRILRENVGSYGRTNTSRPRNGR